MPPWTRDARMPVNQVNRWFLTDIMGTRPVPDLRPWVGGQVFMAPLVHRWHSQGQRQEVSLRMPDSGKQVARESSCLWKGAGTQVSSKKDQVARGPRAMGRGLTDASCNSPPSFWRYQDASLSMQMTSPELLATLLRSCATPVCELIQPREEGF